LFVLLCVYYSVPHPGPCISLDMIDKRVAEQMRQHPNFNESIVRMLIDEKYSGVRRCE
jgi:uncharacterized protein YneF (UPF0154 family)